MKFPWVSRERLDEAERRLNKAEEERQRYLDMLLSGAVPDRRPEIRAVERATREPEEVDETEPAAPAEQAGAQAFSTPFDRLEKRFDRTFGKGRIPAEFRARAN